MSDLVERARKLDGGTGSLIDLMADRIEQLEAEVKLVNNTYALNRRIKQLEAVVDAARAYRFAADKDERRTLDKPLVKALAAWELHSIGESFC